MSLDRNQVPAAHYAKHITVDVTNGGVGDRVGAYLSSRMPIQVKDEGGKELHGFFTENETNNWKTIFAARARDMVNDPANRLFAPLYHGAAGKSRTIFLFCHLFCEIFLFFFLLSRDAAAFFHPQRSKPFRGRFRISQ